MTACKECGSDNDGTAVVCDGCGAPLENPSVRALLGTTVLGAYQLVEIIGKGGMSVVYKARHRVTEQVVALKILPAELAVHDDIKARFVEEAKALARLEHPSIVRLYNFGEENGRFVLAMQYVEGTTFERRIFTAGRLDWREAVGIASQVLGALDYAHRRGIVHRDIKPSNVLVRADGTAMVMDFGIAKMAEGSSRLTATGQTMGTVRYMSPEQVRGKVLDHRSDLYSVGATLYEAIVGDTPFDGATHFDIMMKHLNEAAPTLRDRLGEDQVPAGLSSAIARALSKDLRGRYQTAARFQQDLDALLEAAGVTPPGVSARSAPRGPRDEADGATTPYVALGEPPAGISGLLEPEAPPRARRRKGWLVGVALGGVVALAAVAVLAIGRSPAARSAPPPAWPEPALAAGFTPTLDRRFDEPEAVRVLAARTVDASRLATRAVSARRRFAAYARDKAGVELAVAPLNIVVARPGVLCAPELYPSGVPEGCAERPPKFRYRPPATLFVLDDEQLEGVNLAEGVSAHLCISTAALVERGCMSAFLPPFWDEVEQAP